MEQLMMSTSLTLVQWYDDRENALVTMYIQCALLEIGRIHSSRLWCEMDFSAGAIIVVKKIYTRTIISFIDSCKSDYTPAMLDNIFLSPRKLLLKRLCPNNKIYAPVSCTLNSGGLKYPYVILNMVCMCWPNMYYFLFHCSMHCKKSRVDST